MNAAGIAPARQIVLASPGQDAVVRPAPAARGVASAVTLAPAVLLAPVPPVEVRRPQLGVAAVESLAHALLIVAANQVAHAALVEPSWCCCDCNQQGQR